MFVCPLITFPAVVFYVGLSVNHFSSVCFVCACLLITFPVVILCVCVFVCLLNTFPTVALYVGLFVNHISSVCFFVCVSVNHISSGCSLCACLLITFPAVCVC